MELELDYLMSRWGVMLPKFQDLAAGFLVRRLGLRFPAGLRGLCPRPTRLGLTRMRALTASSNRLRHKNVTIESVTDEG